MSRRPRRLTHLRSVHHYEVDAYARPAPLSPSSPAANIDVQSWSDSRDTMPKQQKEENVIRVSVMTKLSWASEGDQSDREISDITLRLGSTTNLMAKSLNDAIAKPFLKAFCKRKNMPSDSIRPSEVQSVLIDGRMITAKEMNYATSSF